NGDVANKIGTYGLAVLARAHGIPFIVAAPLSSFDPVMASGESIPLEERDAAEVTHVRDVSIAPEDTAALNPAFDVTPAEFVTAFPTEFGVVWPPYDASIDALLAGLRAEEALPTPRVRRARARRGARGASFSRLRRLQSRASRSY